MGPGLLVTSIIKLINFVIMDFVSLFVCLIGFKTSNQIRKNIVVLDSPDMDECLRLNITTL